MHVFPVFERRLCNCALMYIHIEGYLDYFFPLVPGAPMSTRPLSALAAPWTPSTLNENAHVDFFPSSSSVPTTTRHDATDSPPIESPLVSDGVFALFPTIPRAVALPAYSAAAPNTNTASTWRSTSVRFGAPSLPWRPPPPPPQHESLSTIASTHSPDYDFSAPRSSKAAAEAMHTSHASVGNSPELSTLVAASAHGYLTPSKLDNNTSRGSRRADSSPSNASTHSSFRDHASTSSKGGLPPPFSAPAPATTTGSASRDRSPLASTSVIRLARQSSREPSAVPTAASLGPRGGTSALDLQLASPMQANADGSYAPSSGGEGDSVVQRVMVPDYLDDEGVGEYVMCGGGGYYDATAGVFIPPLFDYDLGDVTAANAAGERMGLSNITPTTVSQRYREEEDDGLDDCDDGRGSSLDSGEQHWLEEQLRGVNM